MINENHVISAGNNCYMSESSIFQIAKNRL